MKKLFVELGGNGWNCFRYGNRNSVVWKSYGNVKNRDVWMNVLKELGDEWGLYEGSSWRGDGSVYGVIKKKRRE